MNNEKINLVVHLKIKADKLKEAKELLSSLVGPSQNEDGCNKYNLYQDCTENNVFTFIEEWESAEALEAHKNTSHYKNFEEKIPLFLDGAPDIHSINIVK